MKAPDWAEAALDHAVEILHDTDRRDEIDATVRQFRADAPAEWTWVKRLGTDGDWDETWDEVAA